MARNGSPDDSPYSDGDPTQYANYGGTSGAAYSEYYEPGPGPYPGQYPAPEPPDPWYRRPAALVGLGALTAVLLALLVYAVVKFAGGDSSGPAGTSTTTSAPATATTSAQVAPAPGPATETVTQSPATTAMTTTAAATTTETPTTTTTTAPPTSTSTSTTVSTSVSTVTETVTTTQRVLPTLPTPPTLFPRPGQ